MPLQVIERQTTKTWYELAESLTSRAVSEASLNSKSVKEIEEEIKTERETREGKYDGCLQEDDALEEEIAEFTDSALAEFQEEVLTAAKATWILSN
jgi:hypothetical protein